MKNRPSRPPDPSPEARARREFLRAAGALSVLAASTGFSLEALAQAAAAPQATPAPQAGPGGSLGAGGGSLNLGGLAKSVTRDPKITNALVAVLKDALVTKNVKTSITKVAKDVVFPEKESKFLNSMSGSDLTGVAKLKDGLSGLDTGTAVGVVKGLFGV